MLDTMKRRGLYVVCCALLVGATTACGSDDAPGGASKPERFVWSDDGRAMLWVPPGAAPASADIRVTLETDTDEWSYLLEPSGLDFATPAALFLRLGNTADGASMLPLPELESAGSGAEPLDAFVLGASVTAGLQDSWLIAPVPHFSKVKTRLPLNPDQNIAWSQGVQVHVPSDAYMDVGQTWTTDLRVWAQYDGNYTITAEASGAARLTKPVSNDRIVYLSPGGSGDWYDVEVPLECQSAGHGTVEVRVQATTSGGAVTDGWLEWGVHCWQPPPAAAPPKPEPATDVGAALRDSETATAGALKAALAEKLGSDQVLGKAAEAFAQAFDPSYAGESSLTLNLPCTECVVDTPYTATATAVTKDLKDHDSVLLTLSGHASSSSTVLVSPPAGAEQASFTQDVSQASASGAPVELDFGFVCKQEGPATVSAYHELRHATMSFDGPVEYRYRSLGFQSQRIDCVAPQAAPCSDGDPLLQTVTALGAFFGINPVALCSSLTIQDILHSLLTIGKKLVANDFSTLKRFGGLLLGLSPAQVAQLFNNSDFPCGTGPNGLTLCVDPQVPVPDGDFLLLYATVASPIPTADTTNHFQYGFVFDADGSAANNYQPSAQYANDFFKGTDRWYAAEYSPATGWKLNVSDASGGGPVSVASNARLIISGNTLLLLLPRSEVGVAAPSFRLTAFRHKGDYGINPPHDWDGSVWPAVADALAPFPN